MNNSTSSNNSSLTDLYPMSPVERYSIVVWGLFTLIVGISGNVLVLYSSIKHKAIKIDKVSLVVKSRIEPFSKILFPNPALPALFVATVGLETNFSTNLCSTGIPADHTEPCCG